MSTSPPIPPPSSLASPAPVPKYEVRLYGLNTAVSTDHIFSFFSANTHVLGVLVHPSSGSTNTTQWAQVWVGSESDVKRCLELEQHLVSSGITIIRASVPTPHPQQGLLTPEAETMPSYNLQIQAPPTPPSLGRGVRPDLSALGFRHIDPQGPLPRNLYIMGLPLDLTQLQFKALFTNYGMVEHSTLLSQLDGLGRRRGFILMSTHREASTAMQAMNGKWVDGFKIDISWALVQREAKHFANGGCGHLPNRVVHPPTVPTRRDPPKECSVLVDNLNPAYFPNAKVIRDVLSNFGPVARVNVLSTSPIQVLISFEHEVSARALLDANGLSLGGRPILTRRYAGPQAAGGLPFDPFGQDLVQRLSKISIGKTASTTTGELKADSEPFIPFAAAVGKGLASELDSPSHPDSHRSSLNDSQGESNSTKVSSGSGLSSKNKMTAQDRWNATPGWTL